MDDPTRNTRFRISLHFDYDREMRLSDVGGGDCSVVPALGSIGNTAFEMFVIVDPTEEPTPIKPSQHIPEHEGHRLPIHYQRRVDVVTSGKHCCAGRTRSGDPCLSIVKAAGQVCRRHNN